MITENGSFLTGRMETATSHPLASGTISAPSHPFTPDVVAYLQRALPVFERAYADPIGLVNQVGRMDEYAAMLGEARQILAAVGRG